MNDETKLTVQAIIGVILFMGILNLVWFGIPGWSLNLAEWNLLGISSTTSFFALYYGVFLGRKYYTATGDIGNLIEKQMGLSSIRDALSALDNIQEKFDSYSPEEKKQLTVIIQTTTDAMLQALDSSLKAQSDPNFSQTDGFTQFFSQSPTSCGNPNVELTEAGIKRRI